MYSIFQDTTALNTMSVTLFTPTVLNNNIFVYTLLGVLFVNVLNIITLKHMLVLHLHSRATIPSPSSKKDISLNGLMRIGDQCVDPQLVSF